MRLVELDPRWYVLEDGGPRVGLTFQCPHCRDERLSVVFHHRGHEIIEDCYIRAHITNSDRQIWDMTGETFEDVTFSPSIDASKDGHWHGFIRNGEIQ